MSKYIGGTLKFMHGNADVFGKYYVGTTQQKKNALKNKKCNKKNKH